MILVIIFLLTEALHTGSLNSSKRHDCHMQLFFSVDIISFRRTVNNSEFFYLEMGLHSQGLNFYMHGAEQLWLNLLKCENLHLVYLQKTHTTF